MPPRPPAQVLPSERIAAAQQLPALEARLRAELLAEGVDPEQAAQVGAGAAFSPSTASHGMRFRHMCWLAKKDMRFCPMCF